MGLLNLFGGDRKKRLSHIKNLVALSALDGQIDKSEIDFIIKVGTRSGLKKTELLKILKYPESVSFRPPNTLEERIDQLYDMVLLMMVDGHIHDNEMAFCKITAQRLGIKKEVIDELVNEVVSKIVDGMERTALRNDLKQKFF
jgi:uncharacterized tellurite resistance protein B-like protein